jgi:hypothetical protein
MLTKNDKGELEQVTDWESYASGYAAAIADVRRPQPPEDEDHWHYYFIAYALGGLFMWWLIQSLEDK